MVNRLHNGFSLIELMVTLTIVGILATIGLPAMRNIMLNQQVRTAVSDLHLALLLARSEAIKRGNNVQVKSNTTWTGGWDVRSGVTVLRARETLDGLSVECSTDSDSAAETCPSGVTFGRSGRPDSYVEFRVFVSGNANVTMRCVAISMSGVPAIAIDNDSDPGNGCS